MLGRVAFVRLMYTVVYLGFVLSVYVGMWLFREWEFFVKAFGEGLTCLNLTE